MSRPISLWRPRPAIGSDEACITILKYALPLATSPSAPYLSSAADAQSLRYVPSLAYFCVKALLPYPDQVHTLGGTHLRYEPAEDPESYDILRALIPTYRVGETLDLSQVDPRLWALIIQLFTNVPSTFRTYTLPLSDEHLPLLLRIPSTPYFSLLTIVELPSCTELTDDTVIELKSIHSLCALDVSGTALSGWGIRRLSKTLSFDAENDSYAGAATAMATTTRRGPWGLRILSLRNCTNIKSDVLDYLADFPLLCVVDLRGTRCLPHFQSLFSPSSDKPLYHPSSMPNALAHLSEMYATSQSLFSSLELFTLRVNALQHQDNSFERLWQNVFDQTPKYPFLPRHRYLPHKAPGVPMRDAEYHMVSLHDGEKYHAEGDEECHEDEENYDEFEEEEEGHDEYGDENEVGSETAEDQDSSAMSDTDDIDEFSDDSGVLEDIAAASEARIHAERQSRLRFYGVENALPPRSRTDTSMYSHNRSSSDAVAGSLMLFRPPAAWSVLPNTVEDAAAKAYQFSHKRPRTTGSGPISDGQSLAADQPRQDDRVKSAMNGLRGMVERRRSTPSAMTFLSGPSKDRTISANPFARKAQGRSGTFVRGEARNGLRARSASGIAVELTEFGAGQSRERSNTRIRQKSHPLGATVRATPESPARPLIPITQLKVPQLPPSLRTTESASKKSLAVRGSAGKNIQTTLPVMIRKADISSASDSRNNAGFSAKDHTMDTRPTKKKNGERVKFDWKKWSATG